MKIKLTFLVLCCFIAFFANAKAHTQIKQIKGNKYYIYYFSTTYNDGKIFTSCFYGYPNNPYTNKGSNCLSLGKRYSYSLKNGDIKRCEEMLDSTHRNK
ncbi:hypothetical protein CGH80_18935 [Vibrio parahaemolyticus]|uniref:hypothetical protein n=1 Tax=Vibrio parahaemolyticus TaxID=670 RepID=UPI00112324BC|nr:hypothetical protein [Vibrio parahaemolyticus]TOM31670.1 hypothetical protein CGH80_18935 [Vibrio parahaemolyticus]